MTSHFQTYQQRVPIGFVQKNGSVLASEEFSRFISLHVYNRIGGIDALTNLELAEIVDAAVARAQQGALGVLQVAQRPPRGGYGIDVVQDAAGASISVAVEELIAGIVPYLPKAKQREVRAGSAVSVSEDARGYTVGVIVEDLIAGIVPYLPRPVPQRGVDDAQAIIASQSFGGR